MSHIMRYSFSFLSVREFRRRKKIPHLMNYRLSHALTQPTALFHLVNQFLMSYLKFTA